jgi:dolichyl-phosphate beta-glucosyltransferase
MNDVKEAINLSLVIPCYNETGRIELLYNGLESFVKQWPAQFEIVIVNDGSKDDTWQKLQAHPFYKQHAGNIKLINQENAGKGGALKHGVAQASGDFILTLDADMAAQPTEVVKWMNMLGWKPDERTIYIGSREHKESTIINEAFKRKLAGNVFNLIVRSLTPLKVNDSQCGFKLYSNRAGKQLFSELETNGWAHDVELLYRGQMHGMAIKEMPLTWEAIEGSKIRLLKDSIAMFNEILNISKKIKRTKQ